MGDQNADYAARLEYFRGEIRAQRISYGDLAELQGLAEHIDPSDVELLEWAGVPEQVGEREVTDAEYVRLQEAADRIAAALKTHSPDTPVVFRCEDYWGDEDPVILGTLLGINYEDSRRAQIDISEADNA